MPTIFSPLRLSLSVQVTRQTFFPNNNAIVTLTIYSFCRLSGYFWSVDITLWMMVAILVEFNVSCNVGSGQLNDHVPPYVYRITLQAAIRISIRV